MAGEYAEGLELADMWYYTVSSGSILDQNGVALSKGAANSQKLSQMENPEQALQGSVFRLETVGIRKFPGVFEQVSLSLIRIFPRWSAERMVSLDRRLTRITLSMERAQQTPVTVVTSSGKGLWIPSTISQWRVGPSLR